MDTYDTLERIYVHDVYSKISSEFDVTRKYHWKSIKSFLSRLPSMCKGIDIGCGNGRNMMFREDLDIVGIDKCPELVEICKDKRLSVLEGDALKIPFKDEIFDFAMSIAVIHHLSNTSRRILAFQEMIRVLKPGGIGLLSVWSYEQPSSSNKKFNLGDNIVKWNSYDKKTKKTIEYERYYHISDNYMFLNFVDRFSEKIKIVSIYNEMGNWYVKFIKKSV